MNIYHFYRFFFFNNQINPLEFIKTNIHDASCGCFRAQSHSFRRFCKQIIVNNFSCNSLAENTENIFARATDIHIYIITSSVADPDPGSK